MNGWFPNRNSNPKMTRILLENVLGLHTIIRVANLRVCRTYADTQRVPFVCFVYELKFCVSLLKLGILRNDNNSICPRGQGKTE